MKKILSIIALMVLTMSASAQTIWNFSNLSDADKALLDADQANWTYDAANLRYANTADYLPNGETLKANGKELEVTKGLLFTAAKKDRIRLSVKEKYQVLMLNDADMTVVIPGLKKGQTIEVVAKTGKSSEAHGFTASNITAEEGSFVESLDKLSNKGKVIADGDVVLKTTAGAMVIYSITVGNADDTNGINTIATDNGIQTAENQAQQWYTMNGLHVNKPTAKGIYVMNGKKVIMK